MGSMSSCFLARKVNSFDCFLDFIHSAITNKPIIEVIGVLDACVISIIITSVVAFFFLELDMAFGRVLVCAHFNNFLSVLDEGVESGNYLHRMTVFFSSLPLGQGFSILVLLTFGGRYFFVVPFALCGTIYPT